MGFSRLRSGCAQGAAGQGWSSAASAASDDQDGTVSYPLRLQSRVSTLSSHRDRDAKVGLGAAQAQEQPRLRVSVLDKNRRILALKEKNSRNEPDYREPTISICTGHSVLWKTRSAKILSLKCHRATQSQCRESQECFQWEYF